MKNSTEMENSTLVSNELEQMRAQIGALKEKLDKQGNIIQPETTKAQFILGYKGYIQLAIRSGQYRKLNVLPIKQGELMGYDPLEETIRVRMVQDEIQREQLQTIGYYAFFEYINGFKKAIYWSREKMLAHADRYSAAFSAYGTTGRYPKVSYDDYVAGKYDQKDEWKYSSFWYKDFDGMSCKTLLRQLRLWLKKKMTHRKKFLK